MTLDALLDRWHARDVRYAYLHHGLARTLPPDQRAAIRAWRTIEIDDLPPESRRIAWLELARWASKS